MDLYSFKSGEVLYWKTPELVLLTCFDVVEAANHIEQTYTRFYGTHMNGHIFASRILRAGDFWKIMENDCCNFMKKCHKCQVHGILIRVSPH